MSLGEWNKKEELVADQALRHLRNYSQFFQGFTTNVRSELSLILKIQEYCYENMNFMNSFYKIMVLFYKRKCLSILTKFMHGVCIRFSFPVIYANLKFLKMPEQKLQLLLELVKSLNRGLTNCT
jgi:hypothetical protein